MEMLLSYKESGLERSKDVIALSRLMKIRKGFTRLHALRLRLERLARM
jgi:hypothetical protein